MASRSVRANSRLIIKICEKCGKEFGCKTDNKDKQEYCSIQCGFASRMERSDKKYIGKKFGRLTVLSRAVSSQNTSYLCRCDCGKEKIVNISSLVRKETVSCGCYRRYIDRLAMSKNGLVQVKQIEVGDRFGRWIILEKTGYSNSGTSLYKCKCDCGTVRNVDRSGLISGMSKSCGCYHKELSAEHARIYFTKHGLSKERWYLQWQKRRRNRADRQTWTRKMEKLLFLTQPVCILCGLDDRLAIDHVIPVSKGGRLEPGNVVVLCKSHNSSKHDLDLDDLEPIFAKAILDSAKQFLDAWNCREQQLSS